MYPFGYIMFPHRDEAFNIDAMARHNKNTIDYFPHEVNHKKTIFILESKYGNDGYATWFKLLELLGKTENHYIDCRNADIYEFMLAYIRVDEEKINNIINTLAKLNAINAELWEKRIIWSGNFISNIEDVYKRRNSNCMYFHDLCQHLSIKCKHKYDIYGNIVNKKPQSKVEESKLKESKVFTPPTIDEVKEYFVVNGYKAEAGEKAWRYYDAGNWHDSRGKPVLSWKQKMRVNWFKDEDKIVKFNLPENPTKPLE